MSGPARPKIALTGATGRTGNAVAHGLAQRSDVQLVACVAPSLASTPTRPVPEGPVAVGDLAELDGDYDVLVDFTHEGPAQQNVRTALRDGAHVVLGTTGIDEQELRALGEEAAERGRGLLYAPNFAIGAVLMMEFAAQAAAYFEDAEVVEAHHAGKRDAPSGTARHTAARIGAARRTGATTATSAAAPARGELVDGVQVHSLRLAGAVAHQEVVFGAAGELLTIRHDAIDRSCYAAGVALAAREVSSLTGLTMGLEHVL